MIEIKFFKSENLLFGFEASGHSMSAPHGQDLICAFVSSACLMAANTVTDVLMLNAFAAAEDGYMKLDIKENPISAQDILNGLMLHLCELQKDYPENINVIISEV
ncbi:MAG: ribosomal-processing cysteine protease Prp [Clostridiales bacterium]|nr:ribosomal-processing cysteine protease Prp [Clostridiales bacterium]